MKTIIAILLLSISTLAFAGTAFFKYEYESGMNKVCVYDYLGSDYAITIKGYKLCPITIEV
jgi:hypothetical protein